MLNLFPRELSFTLNQWQCETTQHSLPASLCCWKKSNK